MEVIDLLGEDDTRDELGLGTIRDALADLLFPGTSTIQSRARYFLFVPWVYRELERKKTGSVESAQAGRKMQGKLRAALMAGGETDGVIGYRAGLNVKRLPTEVYWSGVRQWELLRFEGSEADYCRSMDGHYRIADPTVQPDGGESNQRTAIRWDPRLPTPPEDWLKGTSFALPLAEANYLHGRILETHPPSLLAHLLDDREIIADDVKFPWKMKHRRPLTPVLVDQLEHARNFSEVLHGAMLLYNRLLADEKPGGQYVDFYDDLLGEWQARLVARKTELGRWRRAAFWQLIRGELHARVRGVTQRFIDRWIDLALSTESVAKSSAATQQIIQQERTVKGSRARLGNARAVENWSGSSGSKQLDYRWGRPVRAVVNDILEGFARA